MIHHFSRTKAKLPPLSSSVQPRSIGHPDPAECSGGRNWSGCCSFQGALKLHLEQPKPCTAHTKSKTWAQSSGSAGSLCSGKGQEEEAISSPLLLAILILSLQLEYKWKAACWTVHTTPILENKELSLKNGLTEKKKIALPHPGWNRSLKGSELILMCKQDVC